MKKITYALVATFAMVVFVVLSGCGGSGSGSGSGSTSLGQNSTLNVYVTDKFGDQYRQVLLTLYSIELSTDGTTFTNVYSDSNGQTLDLKSMATTAQFLNSVDIPAGTYSKAKVTFADHVTLVANDGSSTSAAVEQTAGTFANGQVSVVVDTPTKASANEKSTLVIDFKIASFELTAGVLHPAIEGHDHHGLDGKDCGGRVRGTVSSLLAGTSFTLTGPQGKSITVLITDATTITNAKDGSAATLADGQRVFVEGSFDAETSTLAATSVVVDDHEMVGPPPMVMGAIGSIDSEAKSFTLTVEHAMGFQPTGGTITVVTNAETMFPKNRRELGSFADLTADARVRVVGTFDEATQTMNAKAVQLNQGLPHH